MRLITTDKERCATCNHKIEYDKFEYRHENWSYQCREPDCMCIHAKGHEQVIKEDNREYY